MKCKNCGTENPDNPDFCIKCGKPFYLKKYNLDWNAIGGGAIAGIFTIAIIYSLCGLENTFYSGVGPALIIAGAVGTILSYNKNLDAGYDLNPLLQGTLAGLIMGLGVVVALMSQSPDITFLIFIISYAFWGFVGACLGAVVNIIRQKDIRLLIPLAIILILGLAAIGYLNTSIQTNNDYETEFSNTMTSIAFNNLIQVEADSYLNKTPKNSTDKISNLKEAQIRYQRMIELTKDAQLWNKEVLKHDSSSIQIEYAKAMAHYLDLKLEFYNETEKGIELALTGDTMGAKKQYNEAKKLIPQITKQKELLDSIASKDSEFKSFIDQIIKGSEDFAKLEKQKNELLTFTVLPPEDS